MEGLAMLLERFSTNQWIILLLVLALGWLLGLLSSSRGKWRRNFETERERRIAVERDRDLRLAEAESRWHARDAHTLPRDGHRSSPIV
jgi:hypothetical protein